MASPAQGAYAIVGTAAAATVGTTGASMTPTWGTGLNRTANNLLVCFIATFGGAAATPSGWSLAFNAAQANCNAYLFYKVAAGSDAAPTFGPNAGTVYVGQLWEFSGNATTSPLDQTGTATGTTSPVTATAGGTDFNSGELLVFCSSDARSAARTPNDTFTSNVGTVTQGGNNNGASSTQHYSFGYILSTTSNSSADTGTMTASATQSILGFAVGIASFKQPPPAPLSNAQKASMFSIFFP